jgi:hypothetical protein
MYVKMVALAQAVTMVVILANVLVDFRAQTVKRVCIVDFIFFHFLLGSVQMRL